LGGWGLWDPRFHKKGCVDGNGEGISEYEFEGGKDSKLVKS